jgi:hypothetical protein
MQELQSPQLSQFLAKLQPYIIGEPKVVNGEKVWSLKQTILADGPVALNKLKDEALLLGIVFSWHPTPKFSLKERATVNQTNNYVFVHSSDLEDGGPQPRTVINPDDTETVKLFQNIRERYKLYGSVDKAQLVPIQLYPSPITPGKYRVWEGHRRELVIFKLLLLTEIKAQISYISEDEAFEAAFTVHIRANLSAYDQGHYISEELMKRFPNKYSTQEAVGKQLCMSQESISRFIGVYREIEAQKPNISSDVIQRVISLPKNTVSYVSQAPEQLKPSILENVIEHNLSERDTKELVKEVNATPEPTAEKVAEEAKRIADAKVQAAEVRAQEYIKEADKVTAKTERAREKIVASVEYPEDLMKAVFGVLGLKGKVDSEKARSLASTAVAVFCQKCVEKQIFAVDSDGQTHLYELGDLVREASTWQ